MTDNEAREIEATLTLSRVPGLSQAQALAMVRHYGTATEALADLGGENMAWALALADDEALQQAAERARHEAAFCADHVTRVLPYASAHYPERLKSNRVKQPPLQLFYCGTGELNRAHVLSVVGTRRITEYGKRMCESLLRELHDLVPDVLVVSGLAYGVDIHAHRAALANGLDTVAVLAHGLDRIYPPLHRDTARQMTLHGGLLSEYFTGTVPDKGLFVCRNRIVAGMAQATLVIESAGKGGSLITAGIASEFDRDVLAVPGRVGDRYSEGCNRLIADNMARLVTSGADIVKVLEWGSEALPAPKTPTAAPQRPPHQAKVLSALTQADSLTLDALAAATGLSVAEMTNVLFDLEVDGLIKRMVGNRFRLKG